MFGASSLPDLVLPPPFLMICYRRVRFVENLAREVRKGPRISQFATSSALSLPARNKTDGGREKKHEVRILPSLHRCWVPESLLDEFVFTTELH